VTSWPAAEARNFNLDRHLDDKTRNARYGRGAAFVEVVKEP
jgi:hypothetical protein